MVVFFIGIKLFSSPLFVLVVVIDFPVVKIVRRKLFFSLVKQKDNSLYRRLVAEEIKTHTGTVFFITNDDDTERAPKASTVLLY